MKNIVLSLLLFLGGVLAKPAAKVSETSFSEQQVVLEIQWSGPRKKVKGPNRAKIASSYFGGGGCRNYKRFCGR